MNGKFINVLMFAAGAAIGSAVTWKVVKTHYERIAQEEIDSVKEVFAERLNDIQEQTSDEDSVEDEPDTEELQVRATTQIDWSDFEDLDEDEDEEEENLAPSEEDLLEYGRLVGTYTNEKGGADKVAKEPYVIAPLDFGELDGYDQVELTYYADGTLEDEDYNIVTDIDELIGPKALTTFGEYEDDAVFVRNEHLCADFQILKDYRTYEQARSVGPDQVDDE